MYPTESWQKSYQRVQPKYYAQTGWTRHHSYYKEIHETLISRSKQKDLIRINNCTYKNTSNSLAGSP